MSSSPESCQKWRSIANAAPALTDCLLTRDPCHGLLSYLFMTATVIRCSVLSFCLSLPRQSSGCDAPSGSINSAVSSTNPSRKKKKKKTPSSNRVNKGIPHPGNLQLEAAWLYRKGFIGTGIQSWKGEGDKLILGNDP